MNEKVMLYIFVGEKGKEGKTILTKHFDNSLRVFDDFVLDIPTEHENIFKELDNRIKDTVIVLNAYKPLSLDFAFQDFVEVLKTKIGDKYNIVVCDFRRE